jgi:hypothetical protein
MASIFVLVLVVLPLITHDAVPGITFDEFVHNRKFLLLFGLLLVYAFAYPLIAFVRVKRHLNGTYASNRSFIEKAFETLQYIKTEETPDKTVYRKISKITRFFQWYEDAVIIYTNENPIIISGLRKAVVRIDRLIDQYLIRASE